MKVVSQRKVKERLVQAYHEMTEEEKTNTPVESLLRQAVDSVFAVLRDNGVKGKLVGDVSGSQVFLPDTEEEE